MDYLKEFNSKLQSLDRSKSLETVFKDFLTLSTYSLAQPFYQSEELEQKYLDVAKQYTKEQVLIFGEMLALLVSALEEKHQDFLGQVFSMNNFGNAKKGQFFTPYHVSKMMSEINIADIEKHLEERDFVTLSEPCCGSGGMIIAFAETLKEQGSNYQHQLYVEAIDIDEICFKMTYVQLSLLGIPAKVIRGDSISMRYFEALYTPFYFLGSFRKKFEDKKETEKLKSVPSHTEPKKSNDGQLTLFNFL